MTSEEAADVATILAHLDKLEKEDTTLYLKGKIEVRSPTGHRVGYVEAYEDWWVFTEARDED